MTDMANLAGFRRPDGSTGCRNHVLVLPTVVCAGLVAKEVAGSSGTAIIHQHGCDHVGGDATQTRRVFTGLVANPNVAAGLLLGLGCETIQGPPLFDSLAASQRNIGYLGIQECGGSATAVADGRAILGRLAASATQLRREPVRASSLTLGIAAGGAEENGAVVRAILGRARAAGAQVVIAFRDDDYTLGRSWAGTSRIRYGDHPSQPVAIVANSGSGVEQHTSLAAAGAQVIVSLRGPRQAPLGFPICPVISVASHAATFMALRDDFDIDGSSASPEALAAQIWSLAVQAFCGKRTAAERRGAHEFAMQRVSRST
jgi:altronate dehydratase